MIEQVKMTVRTSGGTLIRVPATLEYEEGRIFFIKSPFALKDEIKAMQGSRWHGYDEDAPRKIWSVADTQRNRVQLNWLLGEDVYAWFDRPLQHFECRPLKRDGVPAQLMSHQHDMIDAGLTYHYQIFAAEMGTGKSISAQMVMENSGVDLWYWVGPKTSLPNMKREFKMWEMPDTIQIEFFTYEGLVRVTDEWDGSKPLPKGVVFDESSRCKNHTSQRSQAAQKLADKIRETYKLEGYVIEMSGTPSPKTPVDWWSNCEIAWPGFLKEGSQKAMEMRLAFMTEECYDAGVFKKRTGWKDDESKCDVCGKTQFDGPHELDSFEPIDFHVFKPSVNEVALLNERLKGLVIVKHKKDCLDLPDKRYRKILCKPTASLLRVAEAIVQAAPNAITGMTLFRELSDGFQYREIEDGMTPCTHCKDGTVEEWFEEGSEDCTYSAIDMLDPALVATLTKRTVPCPLCDGTREVIKRVRISREVPCPKDKALKLLLDENEEQGRLVVFAGFTGSIDRIVRLCLKDKWNVVRCDQGNFQVFTHDGTDVTEEPLDYWANLTNERVVFAANPESGGMSLTLTEARTAVYWSNSFKPEYRTQSEDRIHRLSMDVNKGATIVDLIHLPSDDRVLQIIRENRRLELMTMGDIMAGASWEAGEGIEEL